MLKIPNNVAPKNWYKMLIELTIFGKVVLIGNMAHMYVEWYSFWCCIWILEAEFVHSTSRSLKLKLVPRCSLQWFYEIACWRCHLRATT